MPYATSVGSHWKMLPYFSGSDCIAVTWATDVDAFRNGAP